MKTLERMKLVRIFNDTIKYAYDRHGGAVALSKAATTYYDADYYPNLFRDDSEVGALSMSKDKTFTAAKKLHEAYPDRAIAVLNFANALRPGGGVVSGATAQEEDLCRCSTLYMTLDQSKIWDKYYNVNRLYDGDIYTDACIYSPNIIVFRDDVTYEILPDDEQFYVDVITCAAPCLNSSSVVRNVSTELLTKRIKHILHVAADNEIDILILGAFGCGVFGNNPEQMARAFRAALTEYRGFFERIEFAIYCKDADNPTNNFGIFDKVLMGHGC